MSESKHSPGPWKLTGGALRAPDGSPVVWSSGTDTYIVVPNPDDRPLLESAPDLAREHAEMLALLRAVYDGDMARDHDEGVHDQIGALRSRIDAREKGGAR